VGFEGDHAPTLADEIRKETRENAVVRTDVRTRPTIAHHSGDGRL
jgi:hypothetical protein